MVIALEDPFIQEKTCLEAIAAFRAVTRVFFRYIKGWVFTKNNPVKVKELEKQLIAQEVFEGP